MFPSAQRLCAASAIRRRSRQAWRSPSLSAARRFAPLRLDFVHDRAAPVGAPLGRTENAGIDALVALGVVAHARRRIEVDRLERPHEGPAQREPIANADINVLDPRIALLDEPERLFQQRALQPVHDEAVDLALHDDRRVTGGAQEARRALDRLRRRPGRGHDLGGRNEIGRIDRVDDETARAALEAFREGRRQDGGGRACENRVRRRGGVEPREHGALHVDVLGGVLLDVDDALERQFKGRRDVDSRGDFASRGAVQKIVRLEVRQQPLDIGQSLARRVLVLIPKRDLAAGAGETDRPGAPDEA